jgi:hypothetical protein
MDTSMDTTPEDQDPIHKTFWTPQQEEMPAPFLPPNNQSAADLREGLSQEIDALRRKSSGKLLDQMTLEALEIVLNCLSQLEPYDGLKVHPDKFNFPKLYEAFDNQMRAVIALLLHERSPQIARWFGMKLGGHITIERLAKLGRPQGSTSRTNTELRQQLFHARNALRARGEHPTQAKVMQRMGIEGDTRRVREMLKQLNIHSWSDFLSLP